MEKLPEKWCVKGTSDNRIKDKGINYFKTFGKDYGFFSSCWYYKDGSFSDKYKREDYTEISFNDFERLVLNKKVNYEIWY